MPKAMAATTRKLIRYPLKLLTWLLSQLLKELLLLLLSEELLEDAADTKRS